MLNMITHGAEKLKQWKMKENFVSVTIVIFQMRVKILDAQSKKA